MTRRHLCPGCQEALLRVARPDELHPAQVKGGQEILKCPGCSLSAPEEVILKLWALYGETKALEALTQSRTENEEQPS